MGAWFTTTVHGYPAISPAEVLGRLVAEHARGGFARQETAQVRAWEQELRLLRTLSAELLSRYSSSGEWGLLLEFEIPRRQRRPDLILLADDVIFVIEFKVGADRFDAASRWQVQDYALDLRDFHEGSRGRRIVPVLVATAARTPLEAPIDQVPPAGQPFVTTVQCVGADRLGDCLLTRYQQLHEPTAARLELGAWERSSYRPALNIIEAAERLFAQQTVRDISHAFASNLAGTCDALVERVEAAQRNHERVICFVTGVPGSGKTLAGLSAAHDPRLRQSGRPAGVFLSGNVPLVRVVREALVRDATMRRYKLKPEARREVPTFIQTMQTFVKAHGPEGANDAPTEHVIIFDEAQRAWNAEHMGRKREIHASEVEIVLDIMERCADWAVIVALVGGGQEIHKGEAGLAEWGRALASRKGRWRVVASPDVLPGAPRRPGGRLVDDNTTLEVSVEKDLRLHLDVSVRSPRAERLADWVDLTLARHPEAARQLLHEVGEFPLVLSRDLDQARSWLRARSRGDRRCGLIASSGARRLRAFGLELSSSFRHGYPYEEWFLAGPEDVRSSFQLEVVASQFECQGLELDWVGLCWGGDLTVDPVSGGWSYRQFTGSRWQTVHSPVDQQFLLNRYRVLLTRARDGMVIWVPRGSNDDPTIEPSRYDTTAAYLAAAGVPQLEWPLQSAGAWRPATG